jgi:RNA polymerase sigma factor (sigma-70 family)
MKSIGAPIFRSTPGPSAAVTWWNDRAVWNRDSLWSTARAMSDPPNFYERIVEPIEDRMIRSVWRITRNEQDADDALQNALVTIWKRRRRIAGHAAPHALILRICVDAACDVARGRARLRSRMSPETAVDPNQLIDVAASPSDDMAQRELRGRIAEAIHRLPRQQAVALTLRVFEELPYGQIATALGCTEATARKHAERARARLRVVLSRDLPDPLSRSRS